VIYGFDGVSQISCGFLCRRSLPWENSYWNLSPPNVWGKECYGTLNISHLDKATDGQGGVIETLLQLNARRSLDTQSVALFKHVFLQLLLPLR